MSYPGVRRSLVGAVELIRQKISSKSDEDPFASTHTDSDSEFRSSEDDDSSEEPVNRIRTMSL